MTKILGNNSISTYTGYRGDFLRTIENNPRLTLDCVGNASGFAYNRPGVIRTFQFFQSFVSMTNLSWVQSRFDMALRYATPADNYTYGAFLLQEERFHPSIEVSWGQTTIAQLIIDGTLTLPNGSVLENLKPWYIRTKGVWNQAWFDGVVASNNSFEATFLTWSAQFGLKLWIAWNDYMHSIGKKSMCLGMSGINADVSNWLGSMRNDYYPGGIWNYIIQNYDLIVSYRDPRNLTEAQLCPYMVQQIRLAGFNKMLIHQLTSCWGTTNSTLDGCPWSLPVADWEFQAVLPYVDGYIVTDFADCTEWSVPDAELPNHVAYPPILVNLADKYINPTPCLFPGSSFTLQVM